MRCRKAKFDDFQCRNENIGVFGRAGEADSSLRDDTAATGKRLLTQGAGPLPEGISNFVSFMRTGFGALSALAMYFTTQLGMS